MGVVSVHEMNGPDLFGAADLDAWHDGTWPVEVIPYWSGMDLSFVLERGLSQIGGDLYLDGSLGAHTAALRAPYSDRQHTGHLELDDATLTDLLEEATHHKLQVAVHAIGDAALRQIVRCWQAVEERLPSVPPDDAPGRGRGGRAHETQQLLDPGGVPQVDPAERQARGGEVHVTVDEARSDRAAVHVDAHRMGRGLGGIVAHPHHAPAAHQQRPGAVAPVAEGDDAVADEQRSTR